MNLKQQKRKLETFACPLCSYSFERDEMRCHDSCPLAKYCEMICCPNCNYRFVCERNLRTRLGKFLARWRCNNEVPFDVCTLDELATECEAEVIKLDLRRNPRLAKLSVYGLAPGSRVEVRQRWPEYVVRIGETDLAMEAAVAASIHVRKTTVPKQRVAGTAS